MDFQVSAEEFIKENLKGDLDNLVGKLVIAGKGDVPAQISSSHGIIFPNMDFYLIFTREKRNITELLQEHIHTLVTHHQTDEANQVEQFLNGFNSSQEEPSYHVILSQKDFDYGIDISKYDTLSMEMHCPPPFFLYGVKGLEEAYFELYDEQVSRRQLAQRDIASLFRERHWKEANIHPLPKFTQGGTLISYLDDILDRYRLAVHKGNKKKVLQIKSDVEVLPVSPAVDLQIQNLFDDALFAPEHVKKRLFYIAKLHDEKYEELEDLEHLPHYGRFLSGDGIISYLAHQYLSPFFHAISHTDDRRCFEIVTGLEREQVPSCIVQDMHQLTAALRNRDATAVSAILQNIKVHYDTLLE